MEGLTSITGSPRDIAMMFNPSASVPCSSQRSTNTALVTFLTSGPPAARRLLPPAAAADRFVAAAAGFETMPWNLSVAKTSAAAASIGKAAAICVGTEQQHRTAVSGTAESGEVHV